MCSIQVKVEDPRGAIPAALIAELTAELAGRYPDIDDGDGSGAFKPEDVLVPRAAFVVAWQHGKTPVGCGALRPMDEDGVGEIKRMYVHPGARGYGISKLILAALEEKARDFGYHTLRLETGTRQTEAIGLYESAGYWRIACYGKYAGEPSSVCYEKAL